MNGHARYGGMVKNVQGLDAVGAEISWNTEFGVRARPVRGVKTELTYFHNDFDSSTALGTVGGGTVPVA